MNKIFVYGSLMFDEVWDSLVKGKFQKSDGQLQGFQRFSIHGEYYPAIVRKNDSHVKGKIISGLSNKHMNILDDFEGHYYQRSKVKVWQGSTNPMLCDAYIFKGKYHHRLSRKEWNPENFHKHQIKLFMKTYQP